MAQIWDLDGPTRLAAPLINFTIRLRLEKEVPMTFIVNRLANTWLVRKDIEYHLLRASMVVIFLFFGYQKWFDYEAQVLIPYISNGPLIFWL
jgi:hypothetical protein